MSKNIKLNNTEYTSISAVELPTAEGATATFKDTDEIVEPRGTKIITTNGLHDVTEYANVNVNVSGDSTTVEKNVVTFNGGIQEVLKPNLDGIKVAHGLSKKPAYAILSSDAVADGTLKGFLVGGAFLGDTYGYIPTDDSTVLIGVLFGTNINTGAVSSYICQYDEGLSRSKLSTWYTDDTYIYIAKAANNQRFSPDITYTLTCYA